MILLNNRFAPVADLLLGAGVKYFQFHAIFGKIWQNRMLAPPEGWRPHLGEILDPPLCTSTTNLSRYLDSFVSVTMIVTTTTTTTYLLYHKIGKSSSPSHTPFNYSRKYGL